MSVEQVEVARNIGEHRDQPKTPERSRRWTPDVAADVPRDIEVIGTFV